MSGKDSASEDEKYFQTVPWCAKLLAEPGWYKTVWGSRTSKGEEGQWEDAFFGEILKSDRTIKALLSLYKKAASGQLGIPPIYEVRTLLSVGNGVNGWPGVAHGGFMASVLDEAMGVLISLNYDSGGQTGFQSRDMPIMTAGLNVSYKRPMITPGDFVVICTFKENRGRKIAVESKFLDAKGTVLATAEAIWIQLKQKL